MNPCMIVYKNFIYPLFCYTLGILPLAYNKTKSTRKMENNKPKEQCMLSHPGYDIYIFCMKQSLMIELLCFPLLIVDLL